MNELNVHELAECRLSLASHVEHKVLADGTVLLKSHLTRRCLALHKTQVEALGRFNGEKNVHDVLFELLKGKTTLGIREFYVLVLHSWVNGILLDLDGSSVSQQDLLPEYDWKVQWGLRPTVILFFTFLPAALWVLYSSEILLPASLPGWLALLLGISFILSLASLTGACALAGFGRKPCDARVRYDRGLPFFDVDTDDSFMGGRLCQAAVALQKLAVPLIASTVAYLLYQQLIVTAGLITLFILSAPFGNTPAHNLLHALFRKDYELPRCANTFLNKRLLWHFCRRGRTLKEEQYLLFYSFYAVAWLGTISLFAGMSVQRFGAVILQNLFFMPDLQTNYFAVVAAVLIAFLLAIPIAYQVWLLVRNAYALALPHISRFDLRWLQPQIRRKTTCKPAMEECVRFLEASLLFMEIPPKQLPEIAAIMDFVEVQAGAVVVREHDRGDDLYVIYSGRMLVSKEDEAGVPKVVALLQNKDVFGEIALLEQVPRTATVTAVTAAQLFVLHRHDFAKFILANLGAERIKVIIQVGCFLRNCSLFKGCPEYTLLRIAHAFERVQFAAGTVIIEQNRVNDAFYVVYEGNCEVFVDGIWAAVMNPGEFFGEISLLENRPASAEVRAKTSLICLKLGYEQFLQVITYHILAGVTVEAEKDARLLHKNKQ